MISTTLQRLNLWLALIGLIVVVRHDGTNFGSGYFHFDDDGETHLYLMTLRRYEKEQAQSL